MNFQTRSHSIGEVIQRIALTDPASLAILSSGYRPFSYAQLLDQINCVAQSLKALGFDASGRIAVYVKDSAQAALAVVAVACSAVAVPLDPSLEETEIALRLRLIDADACCALHGETTAARNAALRCGIPFIELIPADDQTLGFSLSAAEGVLKRQHHTSVPDTTAVIFQTSGTTAEPKLVPCLHSNVLATTSNARTWFNLGAHDRCLCLAPPYYSHGLTLTILAPLLSGGSVAFPSSLFRVSLPEWFEMLGPTWFSASPAMLLMISEMLETVPTGLKHQLRFASSGGAQLPATVRASLERLLGIHILEHYGMTEASQISANLPPPGRNKPGTAGIPPSGTVMIAGPDGNHAPQGETGEILVRGSNVMPGYIHNPACNPEAYRDGWFRTGDLGYFDNEGFLHINGRIKELINRGGEKISPFEIEAILMQHPHVLEAAAFAVPHPRLGDDIGAAVVLQPGTTVAADEFRRFMRTKTSWNKIPRRVHVVESIPRGPGGKVLRNHMSGVFS